MRERAYGGGREREEDLDLGEEVDEEDKDQIDHIRFEQHKITVVVINQRLTCRGWTESLANPQQI